MKQEVKKGRNLKQNISGSFGTGAFDFNSYGFFYDKTTTTKATLTQEFIADPALPTLVLVSSPYCIACKAEHQHVQKLIDEGKLDLSKLNLLSLVITLSFESDGDFDYIKEFYHETKMSWPASFDEEMNFFEAYCPEPMTPCAVLLKPNSKDPFWAKISDFNVNDVTKYLE